MLLASIPSLDSEDEESEGEDQTFNSPEELAAFMNKG